MPKVTVYIPDDLKARMDSVGDGLNWSSIAQVAFSSAIATNEIRKGPKNMTAVIDRLRASKLRSESEQHALGKEAGRKWAQEEAEYDQLQALDANNTITDMDLESFRMSLDPDGDLELSDWQNFWREKIGYTRPSESVLDGFVEGALDVYEEVKDQL